MMQHLGPSERRDGHWGGKCDKSLGKTAFLEMLEVILHCLLYEMSIFVSQETFPDVPIANPAAGLDIDMYFWVSQHLPVG